MTTTETVLDPSPIDHRLPGNRVALAGALLIVAEFVGIVVAHVHTMPLLPGASSHALLTTYTGQIGAIGFLVGWFTLTSPARVLFVLGVRQALVRAGRPSPLLDYAVVLMGLTAALEVVEYAVCAGTAVAADTGDVAGVRSLDTVAHFAQVGLYGPGGLAALILAVALLRSGGFPKVLAALMGLVGLVGFLNGTLLSGPSRAALQDGLTAVNLLAFLVYLAVGIVLALRTRTGAVGQRSR